MTLKHLRLWTLLALAVAACGGSTTGSVARSPAGRSAMAQSQDARPAADESFAEPSAAASPEAQPGASMPAPASGDSFEGRAAEEAPALTRRQSKRRPGLGTEWGETRYSRVSSAPFYRASETPVAVLTLHYNDEPGIQAMLDGASRSYERAAIGLAGGRVTVSIVDAYGDPLPSVKSGARIYVVGNDGDRYAIRLQNHSRYRAEIVATVDGLDVLDGRPGSYAKRGYLLQPHSSLTIDGYRQSMEEVAAFRFGSVRRSYAARKGNDRNVGVIGVALFGEAGQPMVWTSEEVWRRRQADPFPHRFAAPPPGSY